LPRDESNRAPRIRRLPDHLVDQIAAGEVVERPASVAKELVENALDADASRLRVEVRGGGRELVAVADDGFGMSPEDARLALERHATSKLQGPDDLARIQSFGFRGEALPAVASVSRLRLRTRARGAELGLELRVEGGRIVEAREAGGPEGTRVEVADLFATVPARRKFLKTEATEWGHVADWLARAALALPQVHFELAREDRPASVWPRTSEPLDRIAAVLSARVAEGLVAASSQEGGASVQGFFSRPDQHRPTASGLYLYVNGRPVRDRLLRHAILEAYRDVLPRGRFPTAIVFVSVPTEAVDVNVHPAKWEVRFADPQGTHRLVRAAARDAFVSRRWLGREGPPTSTRPVPLAYGRDRGGAPERPGAPASQGDWIFADAPPEAGLPGGGSALRFGELRNLGQLLGTYLVLEDKDGLLLVDQHAAHERVLYEQLRHSWKEGAVARQALLAPEVVELAPADRAALDAELELAARVGFELEPFDEAALAVRAVPALLAGRDPQVLVRGLADELRQAGEVGNRPRDDSRLLDAADRVFASLACHSARTAGEVLEPREQAALLESLDGIPWAPTCPHGRPVAVPVSLAEIERRFGRR
jgi:DNA mismatch repair protein MutL